MDAGVPATVASHGVGRVFALRCDRLDPAVRSGRHQHAVLDGFPSRTTPDRPGRHRRTVGDRGLEIAVAVVALRVRAGAKPGRPKERGRSSPSKTPPSNPGPSWADRGWPRSTAGSPGLSPPVYS